MNQNNKALKWSLIFALLVLVSCSKPYYGFTQEEWEDLSVKEQMAVKEDYQTVIKSRRAQKHQDTIVDIKQQVISRGRKVR